jgi:hypothetical protein
MSAAQRTAWDAYLTLARGLLPALGDDQVDAAALTSEAVHLHRRGDRADLTDLLRAMANRLYLLSAGPRLPDRNGGDRNPP